MDNSDNAGNRWAADFSVDPAEVEAEFDAEAAGYDQNLKDWDYQVPKAGVKILAEYVTPSAQILEAGCGTGLVGDELDAMGYRNLRGCDISSQMLAIAASKNVYQQLDRADLCRTLPYDDDVFDAVTCLGTLSFIEDAEPTWREFCRVCVPGGVVLFSHRCDLFESRDCLQLCRKLEQEGLWSREFHSDGESYIPGHPAYTDRLRVRYFVYRVGQSGASS